MNNELFVSSLLNRINNRFKVKISNIRCDNAGENIKLERRTASSDWKLNIDFEYTARNTPQQNSLVEKGFDTLYNRGRAMLNNTV